MPLLKYEQIAESLRIRISEGEFGPGDLLPSGRDLCEQWAVSRATVIKAMDVLRGDGLVAARQGTGFTVVETPVARPVGGDSPDRPGCPAGAPSGVWGRRGRRSRPGGWPRRWGSAPGPSLFAVTG